MYTHRTRTYYIGYISSLRHCRIQRDHYHNVLEEKKDKSMFNAGYFANAQKVTARGGNNTIATVYCAIRRRGGSSRRSGPNQDNVKYAAYKGFTNSCCSSSPFPCFSTSLPLFVGISHTMGPWHNKIFLLRTSVLAGTDKVWRNFPRVGHTYL